MKSTYFICFMCDDRFIYLGENNQAINRRCTCGGTRYIIIKSERHEST
jgi:hypothetical protein